MIESRKRLYGYLLDQRRSDFKSVKSVAEVNYMFCFGVNDREATDFRSEQETGLAVLRTVYNTARQVASHDGNNNETG